MDSDKSVAAHFTQHCYILTNCASPSEAVSVATDPPPNCDSEQYTAGTQVQPAAHPTLVYNFDQWSGDASGSVNPTTVTMNADKSVTATFIEGGDVEPAFVYLPLVLREWPPVPEAPVLYAISSPNGDGIYSAVWSSSPRTQNYILQECTNAAFSGASQVYTGSSTGYNITDRGAARFFYHVQARNAWGSSGWSNVEWVDVLWEMEPNEDALTQANGPIVSGVTYYGRGERPRGEPPQHQQQTGQGRH